MWALDGHDKFSRFGIEIYAAIDTFSRKILWFYVGLSNKTEISVARQYLNAVKQSNWCPQFLRTDSDVETPLMCVAHYALYWQDCQRRGVTQDVDVEDCYIYGPSTSNVRIESLWSRLRNGQTDSWIRFFRRLEALELFQQHREADRVVLTFIFLPILRAEIHTWAQDWNTHRIRRQPNRGAEHVSGVPNDLYGQIDRRRGFPPDREVLEALELATNVQGLHDEVVLTLDTTTWMQATLQAILPGVRPTASDFIRRGGLEIPLYYRELVALTRAHQANGGEPPLQFANKPYVAELAELAD